ncbi:GIY-YIG nuclease family protein [Planococcus sp. 1R117A]|uniref:GIY-YIG nuclease family protein n=1 Tax=Planococcus sp. 1R117A TaxID=3447020 RepID=UPI003EDC94A1
MREKIQDLLKKENYAFDKEKWKSIENVPFLINTDTTPLLNKIKKNMGVTKGIYIFSDSNERILYIGKGAPIYNRIRRHFAKLKNCSPSMHEEAPRQELPSAITIHWVEIEQPETREIVEHMLAYTLKPAYKKWHIV